jgi:zinc protease
VSQITPEPPQNETRYVHLQHPAFPPFVGLAYKGPAYSDKNMDGAALSVLMSLMFSEKSDLYNQLVIKEQKARSIDGNLFDTRDPYLCELSASLVNAADLQYVKDAITKEIEKRKVVPVDINMLNETKSRIKYGFAMGADSPSSIAEALSSMIWVTGDPESLNTAYANIEKVTPQDIMDAAKKYLTTQNLTIATISPEKEGTVK